MRPKPTIQKLLAALLLVLFTISFIPKNYFHDVIANHTDAVSCEHPSQELPCVHNRGFHCDFNDLVVTAPYIPVTVQFSIVLLPQVNPAVADGYTVYFQQNFTGTESRGPPAGSV